MEPAEFFGHFDGAALLVLLFANAIVWKLGWLKRLSPPLIVGWLLLFGLVMPFASAMYEARQYQQCIIMTDSTELRYVSFRFPLWWIIGLLQLLVMMFVLMPRGKGQIKSAGRVSGEGI